MRSTDEASALRAVVILSETFPGETEERLKALIHRQIQVAQTEEWPAMAERRATIAMVPASLLQAVQIALALPVQGDGQAAAQRAHSCRARGRA